MPFAFSTRRAALSALTCPARLIATASLIIASGGCTTAGVVGIASSALAAGLEAAGLNPAAREADTRRIRIALNASESLNTTEGGRSLALLIKVYQLRSVQSFSRVHADALLDPLRERETLGQDLLSVRELTLTPGARRTLDEALLEGTQNIAVVAMFRAPAPNRWRYAFDASASIETGISLGFHGCAMTVGSGSLSGTEIGRRAISLAGVRCDEAARPPSATHPTVKNFSG